MKAAKQGDTVRVHYTGTLEDGQTFDSSRGGDPLEFTIGAGQVIPGFEIVVTGMKPGETRKERIDAGNAYGETREDLVFEVERSMLPDDASVGEGDFLAVELPDGSRTPVRVREMGDEQITLDANHPLAGKALTFEVELVSIA